MVKTVEQFVNRFASAELQQDGTWIVFNDVTGIMQLKGVSLQSALVALKEMEQHYLAIERGW